MVSRYIIKIMVEETTREKTMIGTIENMALFGKWMPSFTGRL